MSIASASAAPKPVAEPSVKVLHLISHQASLQVIDLGKKGASPGDQVIETTVDFQHGKRVDRSVLTASTSRPPHTGSTCCVMGLLCSRTGRSRSQGETNFHEPFTVAVTDGTGAYQKVGGQLTVERTLPDGTTDVETLRLIFLETD